MTLKDILDAGFPSSDSPIIGPKKTRRRMPTGRTSILDKIVQEARTGPYPPEVFVAPAELPTENFFNASDKTLDAPADSDVSLVYNAQDIQPASNKPVEPGRTMTMKTLTLKGLSKSGKTAIYTGLATALRLPISAFEGKQPPASFTADGAFADPKQPKQPRAKMTPEERKAARAAAPKPTLAEKVQRAEARAAKLREKLASEAQASI